jgi:mono/diheme cytochrome c family protein
MPHVLLVAAALVVALLPLPARAGGPTHRIPPSVQPDGDAVKGRRYLVDGDYIGCGVPESLYRQVFGAGGPKLKGRAKKNRDLPYAFSRTTDRETGARVVAANCLFCHASPAPGSGELVIGLGNPQLDFTHNQGEDAAAAKMAAGLGMLPLGTQQRRALERWSDRVMATGPFLVTRSRGANPADNLAAALFSRRDPKTLSWSATPRMAPPPTEPVPTDVPPWWGVGKKNAMFFTSAGRGDHARFMMTASALCTDNTDDAEEIYENFKDVRAYLASLEAPAWPWAVDERLAASGRSLFEKRCASCHGRGDDDARYPNLWVEVDEVGTDPALARSGIYGERFTKWFNESFYGQGASFSPQPGYVAPPLDGVWATAPYLHNGSVPTLEALLDSSKRPARFRRGFRSRDFDKEAVGWRWSAARSDDDDTNVWDASRAGYGNQGHTYADELDDEQRRALLEYLKTL